MMSQELDVKRLFNVSIQELAWLKRQIIASWVWLMFISLGLGIAVGYWAWRQKPLYQPSVRALLNLDQGGTSSLGLSSISSMLTGTNNAFVMNLERASSLVETGTLGPTNGFADSFFLRSWGLEEKVVRKFQAKNSSIGQGEIQPLSIRGFLEPLPSVCLKIGGVHHPVK
jgi:hypothetical protein